MTIQALRRRWRGQQPDHSGAPAVYPITDEPDHEIFACPVCGRPLGRGALHCPGCGTRLLLQVPLKRAAVLLSVGLAAGLFVGGSLTAIVASVTRPVVVTPAGVVGVSDAQTAVSGTGGSVASAPVPAEAASALRLTMTIDARLASARTSLSTQLRAGSFDTQAAVATLRSIAGDAAWGSDVVVRFRGWSAADSLRLQLAAYYDTIRASARNALGSSVTNATAYRTSAKRMVALLGATSPATRSAITSLAASSGVSLPSTAPTASP